MVFLLGAAPFLFLQTATGEGCKFPFKLNGISEEFFDCVRLYANNRGEYEEISSGDPWCPLELESDGSYVIGAKLKYCKSESLPEVGFPGQTASTSNVESPNLKPDSMDRECSVSSDCGKEEYCKTIHAIDEFLGTQCRDKLAQGDVCDSADSCQNGLVCKSWNELGEDPIMDGPSGRCEAPTGTKKQDIRIELEENEEHRIFYKNTYDFKDYDIDVFGFDNKTVRSVRITALPQRGVLKNFGEKVRLNEEIRKHNLNMVFQPDRDDDGEDYATMQFKVTGAYDTESSNYTIHFTVSAPEIIDYTGLKPLKPDSMDNHAPTAANNTVTLKEDYSHIIDENDLRFRDEDDDKLQYVTITGVPDKGALTLNGARGARYVVRNQKIAARDLEDGKLVFTPGANENGDNYAHMKFTVTDEEDEESEDEYTLTFDVSPVGDRPTAGNNFITIKEDCAHKIVEKDLKYKDVDEDKLQYVKICALPEKGELTLNKQKVVVNQKIAADDVHDEKLVFTPGADENGDNYATIKFKVTDDDDDESKDDYALTFHVKPVADKPHGKDNVLKIDANETKRIEKEDWGFSNPADKTAFRSVRITALPSKGRLIDLEGKDIGKNHRRDPEELVYIPKPDEFGDDYDALKFTVIDSANTESADEYRLSFNVKEPERTHYIRRQ